MTNKKIKFRKWLCKTFGHKASLVDRAMSDIKQIAKNKDELDPRVICERCGEEFIPKPLTSLN